MALKQYKPNTPGQRGLVLVDKSDLFKGKPIKRLTVGLNKSGGRNNSGKITMWQRGGGHKRRYRIIDFKIINFIYFIVVPFSLSPVLECSQNNPKNFRKICGA